MKKYTLLAITILFVATNYQSQAQAQDIPYIEVFGAAQRNVQPDNIHYTVSINTEKFYEEYEYNYEYEEFDPVKHREIQDKVELRANSAKKQLMEVFNKAGIKDHEVQSDKYNLIDSDIYSADSYLVKVSNFEILEKLVNQLRAFDVFQGRIAHMSHSDEEKILEALKLEALKKASIKAQKMAKTLNSNTGPVIQIRESKSNQGVETPYQNNYYDNLDYYNNRRGHSNPVEQTIRFKAEVWVRFALM